ncbi:GNAT family N-acetyltransferase [Alginatibacterium sediminis]|uniref:GNAT family N-acetyltransferase n=1 Tax=Alginatibacterium sediminis TaxID=2164068 RepID=A0A420EBY7_9ALTE|nr:GNAT family N-acetyltransferase [Alginatibacterium sediminis]RKF18163.1 GNAT family N-acetyltransferase [Alginatibacterium sediminis]
MINIREMQDAEFAAYSCYFVEDYARDIEENQGYSSETAITMAKESLDRCFPNKLESNQHSLLCIESIDGDSPVLCGYLWHSIDQSESSSFIYDFFVFENFRGQGIGREAIKTLEQQLKKVGINQLKLRVAYHNQRALKLYQELGFSVTGYNMSKQL